MDKSSKTESVSRVEAVAIPTDPRTRLDRKGLALALTAAGFPITETTLATKAVRGGGPPYALWGRKPLYQWRDALAWAESRLSTPVRSTAEAAQVRAA
jgi:hypothetical protein